MHLIFLGFLLHEISYDLLWYCNLVFMLPKAKRILSSVPLLVRVSRRREWIRLMITSYSLPSYVSLGVPLLLLLT